MNKELQEAFLLRKNHEFQKAVEIYQVVWQQNPLLFDDWAGWSYAFSLSALQRYGAALEICRALYPRYKSAEMLNAVYAKCIYYTQFVAHQKPPIEGLRKAARAMVQLYPPHLPYSYTPIAIFKLIKRLMEDPHIDWAEIEDWLLKMDPDLLNDNSFKIVNEKGRQIELASPREEWYSLMIRVKGGQGKPRELLELLEVARKQNIKWHYNNDIWFARKEAFALNTLGKRQQAENILRRILNQKKDWFLLYDLARIVANEEERFQLMLKAALSPGKDEHKVKLYHSIFEQLSNWGKEPRAAGLHLCLIAAVREESGWPVKEELLQLIQETGLDCGAEGSSLAIKKELALFWGNCLFKDGGRLTGVVASLFENNKAGFISGNDGKKYYFTTRKLEGLVKKGSKVSFELADSFDKKKNQPTVIAKNIYLL